MNIKGANFRNILDIYYYYNDTFDTAKHLLYLIKNEQHIELQRYIFPHDKTRHSERSGPSNENVNKLIKCCSIMEIASLICYIPDVRKTEFGTTINTILSDYTIQNYCTDIYPSKLTHLFLKRLKNNNNTTTTIDQHHINNFIISFLNLDRVFSTSLDGSSFSQLINSSKHTKELQITLQSPQIYANNLLPLHNNSTTTILQEMELFLQGCFDLQKLLEQNNNYHLLQSATWHHYAYWFKKNKTNLNETFTNIIAAFSNWKSEYYNYETDKCICEFIDKTATTISLLTSDNFQEPINSLYLNYFNSLDDEFQQKKSIADDNMTKSTKSIDSYMASTAQYANRKYYKFSMPIQSLIGIGAAKQTPEKIKDLGVSKPLIVTDKGVVKAGICKQITDILDAAGMKYHVYDETIPNPTDENVHKGVEVYKKEGCDSLITLGGGSSHDCGKGIGLVVSNGGKIHDYEGVDKSSKPFMPYLAVNTTAGTASKMTRFCIITDLSRHVKMAIVDWRVTPHIAINDPVLMVGMPPELTAATGMDALTHAVEAFVSTIANPMTDACAIEAIKLIFKYLRKAYANGQDMEAREGMCFAEYLAGMAFNNASLGHVHVIAHQLGDFYDLPHGERNAILLPRVESFNLIENAEKLAELAEIMGENISDLALRDAAELAIKAIRKLSSDVGIPHGLFVLGLFAKPTVRPTDTQTTPIDSLKDKFGQPNLDPSTNKENLHYKIQL